MTLLQFLCDDETYEPDADDYQYQQDPYEKDICYNEVQIIIESYPNNIQN